MTKSRPDGRNESVAQPRAQCGRIVFLVHKKGGGYGRFIPTIKTSKGYKKFCAELEGCTNRKWIADHDNIFDQVFKNTGQIPGLNFHFSEKIQIMDSIIFLKIIHL